MKFVLATTALAAAMSFAPAFAPASAQEAADQASPPSATEGSIEVEGVKPSRVLGAIDTSKLVAPDHGAADAPPPAPGQTTTITTIETPAETARPLVTIASVNVPLPQEVASVASTGKYTTKDLVNAQLMAMNNAPPLKQPVINTTTITTPDDTATPNAPATAGQGDQPRTAEGASGHSGDDTSPPSAGSSAPG
jgi:hypothetical protein